MKVNLLDLAWVCRVVSSQGAYPGSLTLRHTLY